MSNNTPILVTGAAGNVGSVGRGVVKLLRERDLQVRALVHRLDERSQVLSEMGAELVVADLTNGADVLRALRDCKRMYFGMSISSPYLQATAIAAAAAKEIHDFEILVNISQMTVSQMSLTEMTESPQQQQHWLGEQVLNWSEVPVAHVRSTIFLEPSLAWRPHQSPKMGQLDCHLARRELHQFPLAMWQESFPQFWKIPPVTEGRSMN
jgi:uncharacterized protein YbjT (DUF2867 family)